MINIRIAKAKLSVVEVPSFEESRRHGQSNLKPLRDGWRVQRTILRERFPRARAPHLALAPDVADADVTEAVADDVMVAAP